MEDIYPEFYNRHYVKYDSAGRIIDAWSDGPHYGRSTESDEKGTVVLHNAKGQYQLRLIVDGVMTEENPNLYTYEGIPIYKFQDGKIFKRTPEEIDYDISQIPPPPPSAMEVLRADVDFILAVQDLA